MHIDTEGYRDNHPCNTSLALLPHWLQPNHVALHFAIKSQVGLLQNLHDPTWHHSGLDHDSFLHPGLPHLWDLLHWGDPAPSVRLRGLRLLLFAPHAIIHESYDDYDLPVELEKANLVE